MFGVQFNLRTPLESSLGTQFINWHCRHHRICITIISNQIHPLLRIPSSVLVKRSLNKNEVQKVCEESMADESQPARALCSTKRFLLEKAKKKKKISGKKHTGKRRLERWAQSQLAATSLKRAWRSTIYKSVEGKQASSSSALCPGCSVPIGNQK